MKSVNLSIYVTVYYFLRAELRQAFHMNTSADVSKFQVVPVHVKLNSA
jgi:hypothetical protein